jgi:aspartate/tyrosine/aromatic aminotransferase
MKFLYTLAAYKKSTDPNKINLGIGAYRDEEGNPYVF